MSWQRGRWLRAVAAAMVVVLLLPVFSGCATPRAPNAVRLVAIVVGETRVAGADERNLVQVQRRGTAIDAYAGMTLEIGDRVWTPDGVEAVIRWPSGSEIFMRPNSAGTIGSFADLIGEVFAKVKGAFSVQTTFVTAAARGTAYQVRAEARGAATVVVVEGQVRIDSPTGAWRALQVGPGSQVVAHPHAPRPTQASVADLRRIEAWVSRLERQIPAPDRALSTGGAAALAIGALIGILLGTARDADDRRQPEEQRPPPRSKAPTGRQ